MDKDAVYLRTRISTPDGGSYDEFILTGSSGDRINTSETYKVRDDWWVRGLKEQPVIKTYSGYIPDFNKDPFKSYTEEEESTNPLTNLVDAFENKYRNEWRASVCLSKQSPTRVRIEYNGKAESGYVIGLDMSRNKGEFTRFVLYMLVLEEEVVGLKVSGIQVPFRFYRDVDYEHSVWKSYIECNLNSGFKDKYNNFVLSKYQKIMRERISVSGLGKYGNVRVVSFGIEPTKMSVDIVVDTVWRMNPYSSSDSDVTNDDVGDEEISENEFMKRYGRHYINKKIVIAIANNQTYQGVITGMRRNNIASTGTSISIEMLEIA